MTAPYIKSLGVLLKGLRVKLLLIEALVFAIPFFFISYILYQNHIHLRSSQIVPVALTLFLILVGLIILRNIFGGFIKIAAGLKRLENDKKVPLKPQKVIVELDKLRKSFNALNKRHKETTNRLNARVFELLNIKELINGAGKKLEIDALLKLLLEKAMAVTGAKNGSVSVVVPEGNGSLRVVASEGNRSGPDQGINHDIASYLKRIGSCDRDSLFFRDSEDVLGIDKSGEVKKGPPSFLVVPIFMEDDLIGILNLSHKGSKTMFDSNDEEIIMIMINEISFALENARLHSKAERYLHDIEESALKLANTNHRYQEEIRKRKRIEVELREREDEYRAILESYPDPVVVYDKAGKVIYSNPAFANVFGWILEEHVGKGLYDFVPREDVPETEIMFEKLWDQGKLKGVESRRYMKDGSIIPVEISGAVYRNKKWRPERSIITIRDIRRQKNLEERLQQAQKLETLGTLAGGITHDFNNILGMIIGYTDLAILDLKEGSKARQNLEEVKKAGSRAKDLVSHILSFRQQDEKTYRPFEIETVVKEALALFKASMPSNIEVHQTIGKDLGTIGADPTQVHRVLMNFCSNAAHAMRKEGGTLEVSVSRVDLDEETAARHKDLCSRSYLRISVHDTGPGVSPEIMDRIFKPYFTTKEKGKGTGLGLAVVQGIVKAHGGAVTVESTLGKGTIFHAYFPTLENVRQMAKGEVAIPSPEVMNG